MPDIDQLRSRFYAEFVYRQDVFKQDYMAEVRDFNLAKWEAPKRAARLSAAVKNYKTSEMLVFILMIGEEMRLDLTPLVVKRLNKTLFGRTGSQKDIVALFGEAGRIHRSADAHPERIEDIASRYHSKAEQHWQRCLHDIEAIKGEYRKAVSADELTRILPRTTNS